MLTKPHKSESLIAGLPLVDNKLTPSLFQRAAARAGLSSKVVKRKLTKINKLIMPAVLLLNNDSACIIVDSDAQDATVIFPESGIGESTISLDALAEQYSGYAIFIKSVHQFDKRASETVKLEHNNWFWGTIARFWPIYIEVFIASILVNSFA
ncbi:MAG TPA: type I secretion system permease/ATPase, partial [Gammaproteobacteria bacterium]|nr:type I secretion system permease/ATPase [Gammaproteobacteria bacterium]